MAKSKKQQQQQQQTDTTQEDQPQEEQTTDIASMINQIVTERLNEKVNVEEIVTSVLRHIETNKPENVEVPKWYKLDAEQCYQQCLTRALSITTTGQTYTYMSNGRNTKMLMRQVIKLANEMFDVLAEEFEISN